MEKMDATITQNYWDYQMENMLFTYDENERQENMINKNNANLVLNPKFIPFYPNMLRSGYSYLECIIFWFIDFFLSNNDRFYCTNEQLGEMLWASEKTISLAIKKLKDNWLLDISYKIKAWGGKVRFIKKVNSDFTKMYSGTLPKCKGIENKIIENNNNIINNNTEFKNSEFSDLKEISLSLWNSILKEKEKSSAKKEKEITVAINWLISDIKSICNDYGVAYDNTRDRQFAKHILTAKEYWEFCDKIWQWRIEFAENVLIASIKINYWKWPLAWPMRIYQNYADVYNQTKSKLQKFQNASVDVL